MTDTKLPKADPAVQTNIQIVLNRVLDLTAELGPRYGAETVINGVFSAYLTICHAQRVPADIVQAILADVAADLPETYANLDKHAGQAPLASATPQGRA